MITSLLIANRGEIACRIIRTARRMGIRTVAVYSDADAKALHVREADEAVHIGPSAAAESYLVGEKIIAAAKKTGAEAIHPGYGFLSENADFAQAVLDAGLIWVGPKAESIRAMGLKDAAKKLMDEAGVPVTPGYLGEDQSAERLAREADTIGYPVLIKAVAGGGGKGMRKVDAAKDFADALESCRREAKAAFGNDDVLLEKWIESPRHIEVQVFGDSHGNVVHLFERDCSLQRRHQKVIEEAPAPGMDEETREAVCAAAVRAAKAVDYEGAGTIEFIADASDGLRADRIWFMEMNTRLQVEHPVTEEITGQDLVEWQLRAASGEALPCSQDELSINGHAIEGRLYAEDPANGFLPSTGRLEVFFAGWPDDDYRIETGYERGDAVSPHYDPMLAKLVAWGEDRDTAIDRLLEEIDRTTVWPVRSNSAFLFAALDHDAFRGAELDTGFIARHADDFAASPEVGEGALAQAVVSFFDEQDRYARYSEWTFPALRGLRLNSPLKRSLTVYFDGQARGIDWCEDRSDRPSAAQSMMMPDGGFLVTKHGAVHHLQFRPPSGTGAGAAGNGAILSPMPGKIIAVSVSEGDTVSAGDKLVTLEAMKMEHTLTAPFDGTVAGLSVEKGGQVSEGAVLARIEAEE